MIATNAQIGRVIRVGRGWVDVTIENKIRRVNTSPGLLVRAGCYLQIINEQGVALLPTSERYTTDVMQ